MNFFQVLKLTFIERYSCELAKHFEQILNVILLVAYAIWFLLRVVIFNNLLKFLEFRIGINR